MSEINNLFEEELSEEEDDDEDSINHVNETKSQHSQYRSHRNTDSPSGSNSYADVPQFDRYEFTSEGYNDYNLEEYNQEKQDEQIEKEFENV